MADPDWMYHQPAPDPWEQTLNKWEKKSMADKYVVENKAGLWKSDRKTADWMDDWSGKVYISKAGWHWMGGKENTRENGPAVDIEVRVMDADQVSKYTADYDILSKEDAKETMDESGDATLYYCLTASTLQSKHTVPSSDYNNATGMLKQFLGLRV